MLREKKQSQRTTYCIFRFLGNVQNNWQIYRRQQVEWWLFGAGGLGGNGEGLPVDMGFLFKGDENVLNLDCGDGYTF